MPEIDDAITQKLIEVAGDPVSTDEDRAAAIKSLKTYAEAKKLLETEPIPEPEPSGIRGFFRRNSEALIKAGTTLTVVGVIAVIEAKGDIIFRSKATKFIS